jgi:hypothetical protein
MRFARSSALVAAAALVAYHNALGCGFVLDDYHYILENPSLRHVGALFWRAYVSAGTAFYRPLSTATFALDRALFGVWAPGYHAHNLLWHIGASIAFLALARKLLDGSAAAVAALLFAVHPLHTEAVTGIVGRTEVMAAAFVFLGARAHLDGRRGLALTCALLAPLCKESGVTLPLVALVADAHLRGWRAALPRVGWYAAPLAIYAALRLHAGVTLPPPATYFAVATPLQGFFTAIDVLGRDLLLMVWPHPLSADYSFAALPISTGITSPRTALTLAALVGLAIAAWRVRAIALAVLLFTATILPVSNLVIRISVLMAERVLYLPSMSVCLLGGAAFAATQSRARSLVAGAVVVALTALTVQRNLDWDNPLVLWRDTVEKVPKSGLAHANLALSCWTVGDRACARAELRTAIALDPSRRDFVETLSEMEKQP